MSSQFEGICYHGEGCSKLKESGRMSIKRSMKQTRMKILMMTFLTMETIALMASAVASSPLGLARVWLNVSCLL